MLQNIKNNAKIKTRNQYFNMLLVPQAIIDEKNGKVPKLKSNMANIQSRDIPTFNDLKITIAIKIQRSPLYDKV